ncbi:galanin receptor type 1-like [Amphiura filiformis]|uniref:galanin receptor type 1-like n=1 Tax=Amphiura filiformis TaxID=82378 RepID=UPI003B21EA89
MTMSSVALEYGEYQNNCTQCVPQVELGPPTGMIRSIYGIFGTILVVGILGNVLVIIAASRRLQGMHKTMSVFITNLSFADLMFLIFCMPFAATIFTIPSWIFGTFMCKFVNFTMYASMLASIYTLVAMSLDRYIAVVYPLKFVNLRTFRKSVAVTLIIWTVSIAFSSPYMYVFTTEQENYTTYSETYCVERWNHTRHRPRYHIFLFLCGYALPFIVITVAYLRILCVLWRKFQPTSDGTQSNISKSKKKVTLMVCIVVTAFGFCWLPHHIINLWMGFGDFEFTTATMIFKIFSLSISSLNSSINPIIYSVMSDNFRHALSKAIHHVLWKRERAASFSHSNKRRRNGALLLRPHRHQHYQNCNHGPNNCLRNNGRENHNNTADTQSQPIMRNNGTLTSGTGNASRQNNQCPPYASSAV